LVIGVFLRFRLAFATRPYRKFTDDHRTLDAVLQRLVVGADAIKGATRSYTSPWDMTRDRRSKDMRSYNLKDGIGADGWFCDPQAPWQKGTV
jgi:IS30 family transposase